METANGEQVIYEGRPSWRSILGFYLAGLLLVAAAAAVAWFADGALLAGVAGAAVFLLLLIAGWVKRLATRYSITDRRLRIQRGIVSRNIEEARIERVQNVNVRQSVLERILQIGTVDFDTASNRPDDTFEFRGIADPSEVVRLVDEAHEANARRLRDEEQPAL